MFRNAFAKRRCLVPAAAFYEWQARPGRQDAVCHRPRRRRPAGLRRHLGGVAIAGWGILRTFAILTTTANAQMAVLHDRMPVILEKADWPGWLGETEVDPATLLRPSAEGVLRMWPVDKRVGNVRNDGPDLLVDVASARSGSLPV